MSMSSGSIGSLDDAHHRPDASLSGPALSLKAVGLLIVALTCLPTATHALPVGLDVRAGQIGVSQFHVPFADDTSPCALSTSHREWSVSPLDKSEKERVRCSEEADAGNLLAQALLGQMLIYGYGGPGDTQKGVAMLKAAALGGSPFARRILGNLYRQGVVVPQDYSVARTWLESAVADGDVVSLELLGAMSVGGEGRAVDHAAAYGYFVKAAAAGSASAATNAARLALVGRGMARDPAVAASWMIRGATGGDPGAQYMLGLSLIRGEGVQPDVDKGVAWLQQAARQGDREAKASLGEAYLRGTGVPKDERRAFGLMLQAATAGSVYAKRRVGDMYESGVGVAKNDARARFWYQAASLERDPIAEYRLSNFYRTGRGGPADLEAAIGWMCGAAEAGMADAQNDLGVMLREGWGTQPNLPGARIWFEKARAQGLGVASLNLSMYAFRGEGEPVDYSKAFRLASEGAERGSDAAAVSAASMAWNGKGTSVDRVRAMKWYQFAAERGNVEAARWVGNQYLAGTVVPRDEQLGLHYLELATNRGDQVSSVSLGAYLAEHHESFAGKTGVEWLEMAAQQRVPVAFAALGGAYWRGVGVTRNPDTAMNWFAQGAKLGDATSQAWLCSVYTFGGNGVQRRPDYAARWCQIASRDGNLDATRILATASNGIGSATGRVYWQWKLADHGDSKFQSMLGDRYDLGEDVSPDLSAATYWFQRAAEQGNTEAQGSLAWHLLTGLGGRTDRYQAFDWALKAAPSNAEAKRMTGVAYAYGLGVDRDRKTGRTWLEHALADGDEWAASDLATLSEIEPARTRDEPRAIALHQQAARGGVEPSEIALALRAIVSGTESNLSRNEQRWLIPANATSDLWFADAFGAASERRRSWDGLSCLNEALLGKPLMQYDIGMRFVTGNGVPRDRALGAAWIARARSNFETALGTQVYAQATRTIEQRLSERMSESEVQRARAISANLNATVENLR